MNKYYLLLSVFTVALFSCKEKQPETVKENPNCISDSMMNMIKADTAALKNINEELKLSGEIGFDENKVVHVYPFSSGQVLSANVSVGDKVSAGQLLAVIKSADVAGNYSDLSAANADIAIAKKQMDNAEQLFKNGISSEREFIEAKETYNKAIANAQKIKEQILINGGGRTSSSGEYRVVAPRSGYVVEKNINPGAFIRNDNSTTLFTIGDTKDVWIWANVYESDIAKVKEGYKARVTTLAYPDSVFIGKVDKVNQTLDPVTKVMKIKIVLNNSGGMLKPEMFASIAVSKTESAKAVCVPSASIINDNGKNFVISYRNKCDFSISPVSVLKVVGACTFLSDGVKEGTYIVTKNQVLLYKQLIDLKNSKK
ncbi:MAG: efflux RND transporter periplasmic adaptor subunit [Chitinophagaceae bacterium]|nr:efflux RND transporter periplasmic adaptor subunit [Chitinophagaceae bacterium]